MVSSGICSANDFLFDPGYPAFQQKMMSQYQFSAAQVDEAMSAAKRIDRILTIMTKPAESKQWYEYRPQFIVDSTINRGVRFKQQYASALWRAEQQYGVPQSIILGILGVETSFGQNKGSFTTLDALATLAFGYPRRSEYFMDELASLLMLAREQGLPANSYKGSYAGALGYPQFMPSNIRKLAIDFNQDGKTDIINDPVDAIGSIAHYLAVNGWQRDQPIGFRANYTGNDDTQIVAPDGQLDKMRPAGEFASLGLKPLNPLTRIDPLDMVNGIRLMEEYGPTYWIVYPNYVTITSYNYSRNYATAVWQLGEAIVNR
ncbi:lytic murein transglycosylase B [Alkanindiges sp. WGS2144]|uniref:lytic murein transglycosylase B n=1 Tax=Alkanindiges sp. WGS2144 TaxID=3366808 RepID=UPI003751A89B